MLQRYAEIEFGLRNTIGAIAVVASTLLFMGEGRATGMQLEQVPFRSFAHELLNGIGAADLSEIPAIGGYGKPRIAVLPFRVDTKIVPADIASEFNTRLMAELTRQGSGTYRFVARETLKSIIREIDTIAELDPDKDDPVAALMRNAQVDILIVGALRRSGDAVALSYKAVSVEDGTMFAATLPQKIVVATLRPVREPATHSVAPPLLPHPVARLPHPVARLPHPVARLPHPVAGLPHPVASVTGRPTVRATQRMLAQLGYQPGEIDGVLSHQTRAAIRKFQRDNFLLPNGRMTRQVGRMLRAKSQMFRTARDFPVRKSALVLP